MELIPVIETLPHKEPVLAIGQKLSELSRGQLFVVWALRQRAFDGHAGSLRLALGFRTTFGLSAVERGLSHFEAMITTLCRHGRKPLAISPLTSPDLSADEQLVLVLCSADYSHQVSERLRILAAMVEETGHKDLLAALRALMNIMEVAGMPPVGASLLSPAPSVHDGTTIH